MSFSYSINTGKYSYADANYLMTTLGFSSTAVAGLSEGPLTFAPDKFLNEYEALFGKTLAVSDGYKFFESSNTEHMDFFLTGNELIYSSGKSVDRIDAYKELFFEKYNAAAAATTDLDVTGGTAINTAYRFDNGGSIISLPASLNATQTENLYQQLENEANLLKSELHESDLAYGGYPEIGYSSAEAKTKLLQQQLDVAMQEFLTMYDQLFGEYKIKAGAHGYDNSLDAIDRKLREQEAASAATMTATLAMEYAQKYYSQTIKPSIEDYVFGQAPLVFATTSTIASHVVVASSPTPITVTVLGIGTVGLNGTQQSDTLANMLKNYSINPAAALNQLEHVFMDENNFSTFNPYSISNFSMDKSLTMGTYGNMLWDMDKGITGGYNGTNPTAGFNSGDLVQELNFDKGSQLTDEQLKEIGDSEDEYINWMVRDSYGVGGLTPEIKNTEYCAEKATFLAKDIFTAAQKIVDLKMQLVTTNIEASLNNKIRAEYEARIGAMKAIMCPTGTDPYTIDIDGQNYILGQDQDQNGSVNSMLEILGVKDTKENIFESIKKLDKNNDGYVSQEELQANKIVLTAVDQNGQLTAGGYDMSLVKGINLADLQKTDGTSNIFGKFTMDLQDKKVSGNVTFEDDAYFNKLFGWDLSKMDNIDEDSSIAPIAIPVSSTKTTAQPETIKEDTVTQVTEEPAETETSAPQVKTDNYSFNFNDADDNKSTIEKLLDQICWKLGITSISSSQKYSILDGIDPNMDVNIAETVIKEDLENFNLSA